jgi:hypothetical protein
LIPQKSNLNIDFLFELFYNLANETPEKNNLTILTDYFSFYKIVTELMFFPRKLKGAVKMSAADTYIKKINELLQNADLELLDFTFQFLQKSVKKPLTPSEEHQQSA